MGRLSAFVKGASSRFLARATDGTSELVISAEAAAESRIRDTSRIAG